MSTIPPTVSSDPNLGSLLSVMRAVDVSPNEDAKFTMSAKFLFTTTVYSLALAALLPTWHWNSRPSLYAFAQNLQQTTLQVEQASLGRQALWLKVRPSSEIYRLDGEISLDGRAIARLTSRGNAINLSRQLKRGMNRIAISGQYAPAGATVSIQLEGETTQANQQTGGSGRLNQLLLVEVR
jgi:hypothetical protein